MPDRQDLTRDQLAEVEWLTGQRAALLFLPIGYGKTVITLTALQDIVDREGPKSVLLVSTRAICLGTWRDEVEKWDHVKMTYESCAGRDRSAIDARPDILSVNFESLVWYLGLVERGEAPKRDILVIDESSKMKSPSAQRVRRLIASSRGNRNARGHVGTFERRFALSGTPVPEGYDNLWAQEACVSTERLLGENITSFRSRYCSSHWNGFANEFEVTKEGRTRIEEALAPIMHMPKRGLDLPEPLFTTVPVPWTERAREEYDTLEGTLRFDLNEDASLEEAIDVMSGPAALINKLRQVCSGFIYDELGEAHYSEDPLAKVLALRELMDRSGDAPILLFYQYRAERDMILENFPEAMTDTRDLTAWNAKRVPLLCLHPRSAGHGLNLQYGSSIVLFYSQPYSYEEWRQAWGRLQRRGQDRPVSVVRFERPNSVERDVNRSVMKKDKTIAQFLANVRERIYGGEP